MGYGTAAIAGFIEGFAGTMAKDINERKTKARDYFEKQVEYARTTGLENRKKVKQTVEENMSIANQLQAVGVPKEVIMAQVNMDPAGLSSFHQQTEKIRASAGRDFTAEEWKAIYKVAEDFKAPDEDISTFINRTYDPISAATKSPEFSEDPEGSLISSMMGFNSMDKARSQLKQTMIAEGLSADDLIRYGDTTPQRTGSATTVTTNYAAIPGSGGGLTITEAGQIRNILDKQGDPALAAFGKTFHEQNGRALSPTDDATTVAEAMTQYLTALGVEGVTRTTVAPLVKGWLLEKGFVFPDEGEDVPIDGAPEPLEGAVQPQVPTEPTTPTSTPVEEPNAAPIDIEAEPHLRVLTDIVIDGKERFLTFVGDNGDGTSVWIDQDGEEIPLSNEKIRSRKN